MIGTPSKRLPVGSEKDPVTAAEVSVDEPRLLAGEDRLWILSPSSVSYYADGQVHEEPDPKPLADISRPFLYKGRPAVIERTPPGYRLAVYTEGDWTFEDHLALDANGPAQDIEKLQVVSEGPTLHVFRQFGSTLYYRAGLPTASDDGEQEWQTVCSVDEDWYAALADGRPVVFRLSAGRGMRRMLRGLRQSGDAWEPFFSHKAGLSDGFAVFTPGPGRLLVMTHSPMSAMRTIEIEDGRTTRERRYGKGFGFPRGFMAMMFIPHITTCAVPLVFALILSGLMRRHRVCQYESAGVRMPFASVGRRAIAQAIDVALLAAPGVAGWLVVMATVFDFERLADNGLHSMLGAFGLVCGAMVWALAGFLIFAAMEGRSGRTPGKWIVGIQVLGADLAPCGFGRALVRNLLKLVDGFFNFLVGVMLVALTENWQRVGDMAARTVVVDVRKSAPGPSA